MLLNMILVFAPEVSIWSAAYLLIMFNQGDTCPNRRALMLQSKIPDSKINITFHISNLSTIGEKASA